MIAKLYKLIGLLLLAAASSAGLWFYVDRTSTRRHIAKLEEEKRVLTEVVKRLGDEKRVAQVVVAEQKTVNGVMHSTLLLVEVDKAGKDLPPKRFEVIGEMAHIDALVIKFDQHFVNEGDALRGHSIALFTRIYGDRQSPAAAAVIDRPGEIPDVYRTADPKTAQFEIDLWKQFWRLADDETYRKEYGVRVANGQGVWGPFQPEKLYTITLESDGGLNIASEPIKGIYLELLKNKTPA